MRKENNMIVGIMKYSVEDLKKLIAETGGKLVFTEDVEFDDIPWCDVGENIVSITSGGNITSNAKYLKISKKNNKKCEYFPNCNKQCKHLDYDFEAGYYCYFLNKWINPNL
jgi:hypothetical protein